MAAALFRRRRGYSHSHPSTLTLRSVCSPGLFGFYGSNSSTASAPLKASQGETRDGRCSVLVGTELLVQKAYDASRNARDQGVDDVLRFARSGDDAAVPQGTQVL